MGKRKYNTRWGDVEKMELRIPVQHAEMLDKIAVRHGVKNKLEVIRIAIDYLGEEGVEIAVIRHKTLEKGREDLWHN